MVVPLIPIAVAGARVAGTAATTAARTAVKGAQTVGKSAAKGALNASRGIQNASVTTRTPIGGSTRAISPQTLQRSDIITTDFLNSKSLPARIIRNRFRKKVRESELNEESNEFDENFVENGVKNWARNTLREQMGGNPAMRRMMNNPRARGVLKVASKVGSKFWLLSVSSFFSFWIFIFGGIGLLLVGTGDADILWGLLKVDSILPASSIGLAFTYLAMLLAFLGYIGIGLWLWLAENKNPLETTLGMGLTFLFCALDMTLGVQLAPWMVLWVLTMEFTPISSKKASN